MPELQIGAPELEECVGARLSRQVDKFRVVVPKRRSGRLLSEVRINASTGSGSAAKLKLGVIGVSRDLSAQNQEIAPGC